MFLAKPASTKFGHAWTQLFANVLASLLVFDKNIHIHKDILKTVASEKLREAQRVSESLRELQRGSACQVVQTTRIRWPWPHLSRIEKESLPNLIGNSLA